MAPVHVTFMVACFNEEKNVAGALEKLALIGQKLGLNYEVLVFDDCSRDATATVVRRYQEDHPDLPVRLFQNKVNRGVAYNFVEGAFQGRGTYYRMVCGDDIEPVETHMALLNHVGDADLIIPYFTKIGQRPLRRHFISKLFTRLVNLASGHKLNYYNGCPIYRREDVLRYHVEATGFGYQAEFLTRLLVEGRSYVEVPCVSIDREGSGSINLRNFLSVAHSLLKIALRRMRVYLFK